MKIYIPVLTGYARHGGVTQFLSNFAFAVEQQKNDYKLYDHSGQVHGAFQVTSFHFYTRVVRKLLLYAYMIIFKWKIKQVDHVFLNPSLGKKSMIREMYYARYCINNNKSFSIFFHGWNWDFANYLDENKTICAKYSQLINGAENVFVLGNEFKDKLTSWGINSDKIHLEKTTVNDDFVPIYPNDNFEKNKLKILFLSRVIRSKGIFEAVDAFQKHLETCPLSEFSIAGTGEDLNELKTYVKDKKINNINFVGFADESMKRDLLAGHDVFLFPTHYPEGMPICIFEAMAYGLTVITRPVGGIPDYFKVNEMGFLIKSKKPKDFTDALNKIIDNKDLRERASKFNHTYVKKNATSSVVGQRLLSRFKTKNDNKH